MNNSFRNQPTRPCLINGAMSLARGILVAGGLLAAVAPLAGATPDSRVLGSIRATFAPGSGILTVRGDKIDNVIAVGRDSAGTILVNGGSVRITGGAPTVASTVLIRVHGLEGEDQLWAEEFNGPLPPIEFIGGEGDDLLVSGSGNDYLDGGPGNDTLAGEGGEDRMLGGEGDDVFVWNAEDGSDLIEGGDGADSLTFNGSEASEIVDLSSQDGQLTLFRNVGPVFIEANGLEEVFVNA